MTIERALTILEYLALHEGEHGVRDLARSLSLSPSTTFRLLQTLTRMGFASYNAETERYRVGMQLVQLGLAALSSFDLMRLAPQTLRKLSSETGETSFLAIVEDGEVVYLAKEEGRFAIQTWAQLGSRRPVHCTALGKAFLAAIPVENAIAILDRKGMPRYTRNTITDLTLLLEELERIRQRGYALDREEVEDGLACIGAVVCDHAGAPVASVSLAGPAGRVLPHEEQYGALVVQATQQLSAALGYRSPLALRNRVSQEAAPEGLLAARGGPSADN